MSSPSPIDQPEAVTALQRSMADDQEIVGMLSGQIDAELAAAQRSAIADFDMPTHALALM